MKELGLIDQPPGKKVDPLDFFDVNLRGMFEKLEVKFRGFSVKEAPEAMETNILLIRQETDTFDDYTVYLDKTFLCHLRSASESDYIGVLWYNFILHVRKWVVCGQGVPMENLIPPAILCDEMVDTEDIVEGIFEKHNSGLFTDMEIAQTFDAATVGLYVARIVVEEPEKLKALTFDDVASLVMTSRRGNWHKLIEDC